MLLLLNIYLHIFISANMIQLFSQKKKAAFGENSKHYCRFWNMLQGWTSVTCMRNTEDREVLKNHLTFPERFYYD